MHQLNNLTYFLFDEGYVWETLELIEQFKEVKGVNGVHLMGHNKEEVISEIINESKKN